MSKSPRMKCPLCETEGALISPKEARRLRMASGLGVREVARILRLNAGYVSFLETGKRRWSKKLEKRFLAAIGERAA